MYVSTSDGDERGAEPDEADEDDQVGRPAREQTTCSTARIARIV